MAREIERKFLVKPERLPSLPIGERIEQGYLIPDRMTIRVRFSEDRAWLTIKGPTDGNARDEFEFLIPVQVAHEMLQAFGSPRRIRKIRYRIPHGDHVWEIDRFLEENNGLIVAEVELSDANESVTLPGWIDCEVTGDSRYYNSYLACNPFSSW